MNIDDSRTTSFDPLGQVDKEILASAVKQRVRNIIRSYNHPTDIIAEPIQNAVDELDEAARERNGERGNLRVVIDCSDGKVTVFDDGRGIVESDVKKLLAPDVTAKAELFKNGRSRGHKGVGLTFLAYGFNFFELESRTESEHYRVRIENARKWLEDSDIRDVPQAELTHLGVGNSGSLSHSGTRITVQVSDQTEPRNLSRSFPNPEYALTVLETQTAAGVFPRDVADRQVTFNATLEYRSIDGTPTTLPVASSFRFPHERLNRGPRVFDLGEYRRNSPPLNPPNSLTKKFNAVYRHFSTDEIAALLSGRNYQGDTLQSDADVEALLRKHEATAYVLVGHSSEYKKTLASSWSVPMNRRIVAPSIRVATGSMISSWQRDLSLSHRGFNVERIWVLVHFVGVEPDMGRKDYPPQILELLAILEDPVADSVAKDAELFLLPSTRSGHKLEYQEPLLKAAARREGPLASQATAPGFDDIDYQSNPAEEQDVVALFNELRGLGVLRHFSPVFFSSSYIYDSYLDYRPDRVPEAVERAFPVNSEALPSQDCRGVAEFKFDGADLVLDLGRELKKWSDLRWLVCWRIKSGNIQAAGRTMTVSPAGENDSDYAGVTHIAQLDSGGSHVLHILALEDFLRRLRSESAPG